jgi:hypothetical protein
MLLWQEPTCCQKLVNTTRPWIWVPPKPVVLSHSIESFSQRTESFGLLSQRI